MVLKLDFSCVQVTDDGNDISAAFSKYINAVVTDFASQYEALLKDKIDVDPTDGMSSLLYLLNAVKRSKQKVYMIVDEYDSFVNDLLFSIDTSAEDLGKAECERQLTTSMLVLKNFGKNIKSFTTKGVIERMFITGITPLAFSDGLASLNMVLDVSGREELEATFGFTQDEVETALRSFCTDETDINNYLQIMTKYFNGYRFNRYQQTTVYNSQCCLYYLSDLQSTRRSPSPSLDPNVYAPGDKVAAFMVNNYLKIDPTAVIRFVVSSSAAELKQTLLPSQLFETSSAASALTTLAYYLYAVC